MRLNEWAHVLCFVTFSNRALVKLISNISDNTLTNHNTHMQASWYLQFYYSPKRNKFNNNRTNMIVRVLGRIQLQAKTKNKCICTKWRTICGLLCAVIAPRTIFDLKKVKKCREKKFLSIQLNWTSAICIEWNVSMCR